MPVSTLNYSAGNYSAAKYSPWNSFAGKEPWSNDICVVVAMMMFAYYILDHQIRKGIDTLADMVNTAEYSATDMAEKTQLELETTQLELETAKHKFNGRLTAFQDGALRRLETLEAALRGLIAAELGLMKTSTSQIRKDLEKGEFGGRPKKKVLGELEEAKLREEAWMKAATLV